MTMVPAQNLSENKQEQKQQQRRRFHGGYVGGGYCSKYSAAESSNSSGSNSFDLMSRLGGAGAEADEGEGYEYSYYNSHTNNYCSSTDKETANWVLGGSDLAAVNPIINPLIINMADQDQDQDQDSRTNSDQEDEEPEAGSSSKQELDRNVDDGGSWLQLSIGGGTTNQNKVVDRLSVDPMSQRSSSGAGGLIELDLLPPGGGHRSLQQGTMMTMMMRPPLGGGGGGGGDAPIFQVPAPRPVVSSFGSGGTSYFFQHHHHQAAAAAAAAARLGLAGATYGSANPQEINWAFRPVVPQNFLAPPNSSSSTSSSSLIPLGMGMGMGMGSYFGRPFPVHAGGSGMDIAGPSSDVRVIAPPRRPHSGVWFMLQASQNQVKEPFLPQIPKSYLRIKDGRMTIRLLMKYLVNKLGLDSESEIEIRCRGQQLQPFLTLQHVRDNIWSSPNSTHFTLLPDSTTSSADHVMVLHYARTP